MTLEDFLSIIANFIRPIKTIFSFYVVIYLIQSGFLIVIGYKAEGRLFINDAQINIPAAILLGIFTILLILWNLFYLIYFTRERTKNPHLYKKGFLSDLSVRDKRR